ncbi:MAG: hypothetical protein JW940_36995 [Polyangiaceae bacterium]|nr:hypothetical protein [Polyangiaceae bacterium]
MNGFQFVDYFRKDKYGFMFFPALGVVCATLVASTLGLAVRGVQLLVAGEMRYMADPNPADSSGYFLITLFLLLALHLARRGGMLPFLAVPALYIGVLLHRAFLYYSGAGAVFYPEFYTSVSFPAFAFQARTVLYWVIQGTVLSSALVLIYKRSGRFIWTLIAGYSLAAGSAALASMATRLGTDSGISWWQVWWQVETVILGAASGILFAGGGAVFLRSRGWLLSREGLKPSGENTSARNSILPTRRYFGSFAILSLLGFFCMPVVLSGMVLTVEAANQPYGKPAGGPGWMELATPIASFVWLAASLVAAIMLCVIVYKMWTVVQDGRARTSPAMACGLLLVPVFNLFWMFRAIRGFATEYNAFLDRNELTVPPLPQKLFLALPILVLTSNVLGGFLLVAQAAGWLQNMRDGIQLHAGLSSAFYSAVTALWCAVVFLVCEAVSRVPAGVFANRQSTPTA